MGVFDDERPTEVICFRATKVAADQVEAALERENATKHAPLTRSRFMARVAELGLSLYATLEHERARFDTVCKANGWTWEEGVRAVFDRGLTAIQAQPPKRR